MKYKPISSLIIGLILLGSSFIVGGGFERPVYEMGSLRGDDSPSAIEIEIALPTVAFTVVDDLAVYYRLQILSADGKIVFDSGITAEWQIFWEAPPVSSESGQSLYIYKLHAWDAAAKNIGGQIGMMDLQPADREIPVIVLLGYDVPGDFTIGGYLGIGTEHPQRAVHIQGANAVFRMDRDRNSASFILARTDNTFGEILKAYTVGVDAWGANQGQFIINDLGTAVAGGGTRRMTIDSNGHVQFTGSVQATDFYTPSSARFKTNVEQLAGALDKLLQLKGVRFIWKETGQPGIGLIAEDVARIFPELVQFSADDHQAMGLDYDKLTAVLVEATREQQAEIDRIARECDELAARWEAELNALKNDIYK